MAIALEALGDLHATPHAAAAKAVRCASAVTEDRLALVRQ